MDPAIKKIFAERTWKDFYDYFETCKLPVNPIDKAWLLELIENNFIMNKQELVDVVAQLAKDDLETKLKDSPVDSKEIHRQYFRKWAPLVTKLKRYYFKSFEN